LPLACTRSARSAHSAHSGVLRKGAAHKRQSSASCRCWGASPPRRDLL